MLGAFLRQRRKLARLSQPKLSQLTGIPQTYISRIERGEVGLPQRATRDKFHEALGTTEREWLDAAGEFGTGEDNGNGSPPAPPPPPPDADRPFNPLLIVAYVEAKPDERFQAQLAREKARRKPESYTGLCLRIYRAWSSNVALVMEELAAIGVES